MRLLVVSEWFPHPPVAGAKIRAYNLIRQLARLADIDLVAQVNTLTPEQVAAGTMHLRQLCDSVESVAAVAYRYSLRSALQVLVDPVPATVRHRRNMPLEAILAKRLANQYDAVVATISGAPSATLLALVRMGARPLVVDSLELGVMRPKPTTPLTRRARNHYTWWHLRRFTRRLLRAIDVVTVTSEAERELFSDLVQNRAQCTVVPTGLDLRDYEPKFGARDPYAVLYAGSFGYMANYEAMHWFAREVFPLVQCRDRLKVRVTGDTAGRDLAPLRGGCPQIEFTGFVNDIRPHFAESRVCIAPILSGGSTRLKIVEAMAWGTPVVSTRVGAEGLAVTDGLDILLADTPADFAACIDRLMVDQELWQTLSDSGRALVAAKYSVDDMCQRYRNIVARLTHVTVPQVRGGQT